MQRRIQGIRMARLLSDPRDMVQQLRTAIASGALMIALAIWVIVKPMEKAAWTLFKFSSPYLAVLFIALMVDSAL